LHVTHPEISKLLKYQKRGYEISKGMHTVEEFVCSNCGNIETKKIDTVVNYGFNCSRCSDAISYPEKFLTSLLQQFEISFEKEKVFEWSKINDEVTNKLINKRYDFYLPDFNIIIETHGGQHFKGGFHTLGGRKLNEEIENDILKESLAEKNGIHKYIVIDCCLSELNYIKNSILNSELVKYININKTNWIKCHEYACNSLVKEACYLWNNCQIISQVAKKLSLCTATITKYLKQGEALGWCNFSNGRKIIQLSNNDDFLKEWDSVSIASKTLGISHISSACSGRRKSAGGYKWMYKENYDKYIENKIISLV
jgi:hypothetical protein